MRYFSMFSGIGGFEVGIEEAFGICRQSDMQRHPKSYINECIPKRGNGTINPACIGFSEIDRYASAYFQPTPRRRDEREDNG